MRITKSIISHLKAKIGNRTQREASQEIGISYQCISKWLNGDISDLRESNARKLCAFLGMDYEAEMRRQERALNKASSPSVNENGNAATTSNGSATVQNIGYCSPPEGCFTPLEIVRKVSTCQATDSEKGTTISVLGRCGIL